MVVADSKGEQIAAGLDIANGTHIDHVELNSCVPNYPHHSFGKVVNGTPYLAVSSTASAFASACACTTASAGADFIAPIIGVDFLNHQIGCCMSSSPDGSNHHALNKISYRP
jgi:hypothetical protein